jgi:DNA-binding NarL/FixJ family response regulator
MTNSLRIALVDRDPAFRAGLRSLLELQGGMHIVLERDSLSGEVESILGAECDLVLLYLPVELDALPLVRALTRRVPVIAIASDAHVGRSIARTGIQGLVIGRFAIDSLTDAIGAVRDGRRWIHPLAPLFRNQTRWPWFPRRAR